MVPYPSCQSHNRHVMSREKGGGQGKVGEVCGGAALTTGPSVVGNMLMRDTVMDVVASMSLLAKQIVFSRS